MKYNELSQNFNPTFRIGFYGLSEQEKKEIEDILGNEFYSYYEASLIEGNELLNQPDIILTKKNDETLEKIKQYCGASSLTVTKTQIESPSTVCFNNEESIEESKRRILDSAIIGNTQKISQIINQSEDGLTIIPELLKKKDKHTYHHIINVVNYSEQISRELGVDEEQINRIRLGAYLYDIGKLCLPDSVLFNTTPKLSKEKWDIMTRHVEMAIRLIPSKYTGEKFTDIRKMITEHHERLDGSGYPNKIKDISFGARILAVCDTYDALTTKCSYQDKHTNNQAMQILYKLSDETDPKLDRSIVNALERTLEDNKVYSNKTR